MATRDAISALGAVSGSATLTVTFTGTQPTSGDKILLGVFAFQSGGISINSVKDNGVVQGTYTQVVTASTSNTDLVWIYYLDSVSLPSSGNYVVTVTFASAPAVADGGAIAYGGLATGTATATNHNAGTTTPGTTGSVSPSGTCTYFGVITNESGGNPATFTWSSPFTRQIAQLNGSSQQAGSIGDDLNGSGSQNASIAFESNFNWVACIGAWPNAAASTAAQVTYAYSSN